jgi:hypothetical protein
MHMAERRSIYSVLAGKSDGKRQLGRPCPTREHRQGTARTLPSYCVAVCIFCFVLCNFFLCVVCFVTFPVLFVYMCTEQLPPGGYSIAVKYIIP